MSLSCIFKTKKLALSKVNEKEFILFFSEREDLEANSFMISKSWTDWQNSDRSNVYFIVAWNLKKIGTPTILFYPKHNKYREQGH